MKKQLSLLVAGFFMAFLAMGSVAQSTDEDVIMAQIDLARAIGQGQVREVIELNLPLTEEESAAFWPRYDEYVSERSELNDRHLGLIMDYAESYNSGQIEDRTADRLISDFFKLEKDKISLKQKYFRRFKRDLPTVKVAQFFQLENRIDLLVDIGLAQSIPLITE